MGFNWLPVFAAQQQGIFARNGLNVEIKRLGTVDKATAAVKSGEVDMAITPPEGAIRDCVGGGNLRIIAGNVNRLPLSLIANPRFRRIEELKGAKLGTSSMTEGTALYTMEVLRQHGLNYPGDYEFAVVGVHPARWKALQEGTIDAAVQLIPLNFVAVDAGYANLGEVTDYIPEIVFTALIVDRAWAQAHRAEVVAFLRGVIEGTRWVYDPANDEQLLAMTMEATQAQGQYGRQVARLHAREEGVCARSFDSGGGIREVHRADAEGRARGCEPRSPAHGPSSTTATAPRPPRPLEANEGAVACRSRLPTFRSTRRPLFVSSAGHFCCRTRSQSSATSRGHRSCSRRSAFVPRRFFVVFTSLMELVAAFGLISGLYPRIGALIAATILVVAAWAIAQMHGLKWRWQHPGIEYMLFWAAVCLCVGFLP